MRAISEVARIYVPKNSVKEREFMKETTLCYIENEDYYLMLYRNKKQDDPNAGKWIGVGGKMEQGETVEGCLLREVKEETGITLEKYEKRGVIDFISDTWEDERMHLFTGTVEKRDSYECNEGTLQWIQKAQVMTLHLWEGDRVFLEKLILGEKDISLILRYEDEKLVSVEEKGNRS